MITINPCDIVKLLTRCTFKDIDLKHSFFDSIRKEYPGFDDWFKSHPDRECLVCSSHGYGLLAFKREDPPDGIEPPLTGSWIKICTLKSQYPGEGVGSTLMRELLDMFPNENIYLTSKSTHPAFSCWLQKYHFVKYGTYKDETVYVRYANQKGEDHV